MRRLTKQFMYGLEEMLEKLAHLDSKEGETNE